MTNPAFSSAGRTSFHEAGDRKNVKPGGSIDAPVSKPPFFAPRPSEKPRLSKKQKIALELADAQTRKDTLRTEGIDRLRELSNAVPRFNVAFIGVKGGAATTTTMVYCASIASDITRSIVFASDFNPASGTAGVALGKDHDATLTLQKLRDELDSITEPSQLTSLLRPTPYGVRVVSANNYVSDQSELYGSLTERMLEMLTRHSEYHFIDTANDITTTSSRKVLDAADLYVFTANAAVKRSLLLLGTGMEAVRNLGYGDKVAKSVVSISNVPPGTSLDNYRMYLNHVNNRGEIIRKFDFDGPFMAIPSDSYVAEDTEVSLEKISWETYQAYLDLDQVLFEQLTP